MPDLANLAQELKGTRDEIRLKVHLGSKEIQEEWSDLEKRWEAFESRAELERSARDVGDALKILGSELRDAYARIRRAL